MTAIDLVVTDLDGTLWHTDDHVHPDVVAAVDVLAHRGIPLLVATGRRAGSARPPLARIGLRPAAIVLNGALGLELASGQRFHRAPFPAGEAIEALAAFRAAGLDPCVYVDHDGIEAVVSTTPSTNPEHLASFGAAAVIGDLDEVVATDAVLAFSIIGIPHPPLAQVAAALAGVCEVHLDRAFDYAGMATLTVAPHRQSKWDGVLAYCRRAGVDPDRVLALADGPNDLELLANAAVSMVPRNGHPAALALASHLIAPAAEGGWAEVLGMVPGS